MKRNKKLMLTAIAAMGVVAMGVGGAGTFAWFKVADASISKANDVVTDVSVASNPYSLGDSFKIEAVVTGVADNVEPTDTSGKSTYYVNYNALEPESGQVAKFTATRPTDEVTVSWKIVHSGDLTNADEIQDLYKAAYAAHANKYVDIAITATGRVKLGTSAERAVSGSDTAAGIVLSFSTALPASPTFVDHIYSASETKSFYFGIVGQDGLDTTLTNFGSITAAVSLASAA